MIVFNKRTMLVHKVIVQVGRQTKFQAQQKAIVTSMIEKLLGKCCFPFRLLQLKFRLRNSDMFEGCLHRLDYSSVCLSILTSCAEVPGLCPAWGGRVVRCAG